MKQLYTILVVLIAATMTFAQNIELTVKVSGTPSSVRLTGPWWGWDPAGGPQATDNGNGTWSVNMTAGSENMQYLWVVDGTTEALLSVAQNGDCTDRAGAENVAGAHMITDYNSYANRIWKLGDGNIVNDVHNSCGTFMNTSSTFDNEASVIGWAGVGDGASDEASVQYVASAGVTSGALQVAGQNPSSAIGKAYIFQYTDSDFNYDGATNVKVEFQAKLNAPLVSSAVHMQTEMPGLGTVNKFDIQGSGLNETDWTSYEYDFENVNPTGTNDIFRIHFNFSAGAAENAGGSLLIDNIVITLSGGGTTEPDPTPENSPTAPTRDAADVISIYSDAYTDIATAYNPGWGQTGTVNTTYDPGDGNNVMLYSNFNYQGTDLANTDVSGMEYLHVDIWVANVDRTVKVSPIGGGNETLVAVATTAGAWNSVDIPLTDFTTVDLTQIVQLKFDGQFQTDGATADTAVRSDVYLDNIYFWKSATASINDLANGFNVYPNPVQNTLNISAGVMVDQVSIFDLTGRQVLRATPKAESFSLDVSDLNKGMYLVSVKAGEQELTTKLVK